LTASANPNHGCRLGLLAFGDSITNGGGELQWGVALQSWAQWVARALGLPFTGCAVDGARVADVVHSQIPAFERRTAHPGVGYELGCLYIGVNDVRSPGWDVGRFEAQFRTAAGFLRGRCDRLLTVAAPLHLGLPPAGAKVHELDGAIERVASEVDALVLDLRGLRARNLVMADRVHPTALGQIAIAERALAVLERDGLAARVRPSTLIQFQTTRWGRLRSDATYAYRYGKWSAAALAARLRR
jgi:lysophospholipase L1-like esterase